MNWYNKIASNTLYQIIARIASSGSTFLITLILVRQFTFSGYGDFAKVSAFVTLFYVAVDFGLNAIFLQRKDAKFRFKELFYTRIILAIILTFLVNIIAYFLPYNPTSGLGFSPTVRYGISIFSFTLITEAILYSTTAIFQRELSYEFYMISSVAGSIVTFIIVWIAALYSHSLLTIYLSFILGGIVQSLLALLFTKESVSPIQFDVPFSKKLMIETLPIALMLIFNLIYFRIDILLLSMLKPSHSVGVYDLAYRFFDFLIALPLFLSNALYPSMLNKVTVHKNFAAMITKYMAVFLFFSVCVVIPVWYLAPALQIINKQFIEIVYPLRILSLSIPIFFVTSILQWILIAKRKRLFLAAIYLLSILINIGLNIIYIPHYSYIASAVITGISELVIFIFFVLKLYLPVKKYG